MEDIAEKMAATTEDALTSDDAPPPSQQQRKGGHGRGESSSSSATHEKLSLHDKFVDKYVYSSPICLTSNKSRKGKKITNTKASLNCWR